MAEKSALRHDPPNYSIEGALDLVRDLCDLLAIENIHYCHWKSSATLDRSARGENDLDLLVSCADALRFTSILYDLGFKQVLDHAGECIPGGFDYYGFDQASEKLVHVHAHYSLDLGHDATRNYHLPIEKPYLDSAYQNGLFKVPAPEFEFVLFVIRMVLKHTTWEVILSGRGALSSSETQELDYLRTRISTEKVQEILDRHLPEVSPDLFDRCIEVIGQKPSLKSRINVSYDLQNKLKAYARRPRPFDAWLILWSRPIRNIQSHVLGKNTKKRLANGGLLIAVVGGDGAGKTDAIREIYTWLSDAFDILSIHMGKPRWSWLTAFVQGILKISRQLGLYAFVKAEIQNSKDRYALKFPGYSWCIHKICIARDRLFAYVKGLRFAIDGGITLCDSYPMPDIKDVDGPQIEMLACDARPRWLIKWLSSLENRYYRQIAVPDLLIVLRRNPYSEVGMRMEITPDPMWERSAGAWEKDWQQTLAWVVDASRSKEQVLSEMKRVIWSYL